MPRRRGGGGPARGRASLRPPAGRRPTKGSDVAAARILDRKQTADTFRNNYYNTSRSGHGGDRFSNKVYDESGKIDSNSNSKYANTNDSPLDSTPTPKTAPVEERWEESQGKYLHKKFKKMATSTVTDHGEEGNCRTNTNGVSTCAAAVMTSTISHPVEPTTAMINFPLKHNALSLVQDAPGVLQSQGSNLQYTQRHQIVLHNNQTPKISSPPSFDRSSSPDDNGSPTSKRGYACPFCLQVCAKPSVLDKHIRTHTNERPFPCGECGFAFKTKSNLSKHRKSRTHQLKVDQGIDSSSADIMAELGDSIKEELDGYPTSSLSQTSQMSISEPTASNHRSVSLQPSVDTQFAAPVNYISAGLGPEVTWTKDTKKCPGERPRFEVAPIDSRLDNGKRIDHNNGQPHSSSESRMAMVHPTMRHITMERLPSSFHADGMGFSLPQQPVGFTQEDRVRGKGDPSLQMISDPSHHTISSSNIPTDLSIGTAKKVAAEVLQQRIDKVISENQAIVETFDSLWPRRYMRQNSKDPEGDKNRLAHRKYSHSNTFSGPVATSTPISSSVSLPNRLQHHPIMSNAPSVTSTSSGALIRPMTRYPEPLLSYLKHPTPYVATQRANGPTTLYFPEKDITSGPVDLATAFSRRTSTPDEQPTTSILSAQSVREVWINSCRQQTMQLQQQGGVQFQPPTSSRSSNTVSEIINVSSGSNNEVTIYRDTAEPNSIKELLLQSRNGYLPTTHHYPSPRRDSASSSGSSSHLMSEQSTIKLHSSQPEVALILTSAIDGVPVPKPKPLITSFSSSSVAASQSIHCNLCQKIFKGTDLELHQREFCPARSLKRSIEISELNSSQSNGFLSPKRSKLTIVATSSPFESSPNSAAKLGNSGGSVVSITRASLPSLPGLLQIAPPALQTAGGISTSSGVSVTPISMPSTTSCVKIDLQSIIPTTVFSIPGVPTPNFSGVLTSIKNSATMPFFSLPGNRVDFNGLTPLEGKSQSNNGPIEFTTSVSKPIPYVFGIPGPESHASTILTQSPAISTNRHTLSLPLSDPILNQKSPPALTITPISLIPMSVTTTSTCVTTTTVISPRLSLTSSPPDSNCTMDETKSPEEAKFLRPNSLPLTPGSFKLKKQVLMNTATTSLVSPETPRPRKSYCLQYQNGTAYTTLGLKCSTKVCYCCIYRLQPMYVHHKPKLSMYSNWRVVSKDFHPSGMTPSDWFGAYSAPIHNTSFGIYSVAKPKSSSIVGGRKVGDGEMIVTHSSQWRRSETPKLSPKTEDNNVSKTSLSEQSSSVATTSSTSTTVEGGYKSFDDDYTYVRGRGRGRYVCNSCGIRCKKPSMLKKHIRTHSNFRPYTCRHCNFAFKTKGNLTKHMKSKAHHKKCVELGISPVPTTVEDGMHEPGIGEQDGLGLHAGDSDSEDDDMEDDEDEDEDQFEDAEGDDDSFVSVNPGTSMSMDKDEISKLHQGLLPNRPKPSTYTSERFTREIRSDQSLTSLGVCNGDGKSEQALVSYNTERAHDLQVDAPDASLNLKHFPPPNTAEKYYFTSPAVSVVTSTAATQLLFTSASVTITQSTTPRSSIIPISLSQPTKPAMPSSSELDTSSKEPPVQVLGPITESDMPLAQPAKTSSTTTSTGSNVYEGQSDPPALRAYLQERAVVRATTSSTPFVATSTTIAPISVATSSATTKTVGGKAPAESPTSPNLTSKVAAATSSAGSSHQTKPPVHNSYEDKFAPRNVTMNVKDLPEELNSASVSRHPQLPQDIHIAAANAATAQTKGGPQPAAATPTSSVASTSGPTDPKSKNAEGNDGGDYNTHQIEIFQTNEDGKSVCGICGKVFQKSSHLRLHVNIHYFERPFRCDSCSVSFRTKGHLQKHKRSVGHFKKVSINATFGTPSASDPRPFKCSECKIAFRIHGHLAKHLRSKTHIMKLECVGKLPIGMYAEMERLGTNMNDIDTSDCENTLESLQQIAVRLYKLDPSKLVGKDEEAVQKLSENLANSDVSDSEDVDMMDIKSEPLANGDELSEDKGQGDDHGGLSLQTLNGVRRLLRRASFSSSGHEDMSTDSEAEKVFHCSKCPDVHFNDANGLHLHNVAEHQVSKPSVPDQATASAPAPNRVVGYPRHREPSGGAPNVVATNRGIPGLTNGFHPSENLVLFRGPHSPTSGPLNLQYRPQLTIQTHGGPLPQSPSPKTTQSAPSPLQMLSPQAARQPNQTSTHPPIIPSQSLPTPLQPMPPFTYSTLTSLTQHQSIPLMPHIHRPQFQTVSSLPQPQTIKVPHSVQLIPNSRAPVHVIKTPSQTHQLVKQPQTSNQQLPIGDKLQSLQHLVVPPQPQHLQPIHLMQHYHALPQAQPMQLPRQSAQVVQRHGHLQLPHQHQLVSPATFSCDLCGLSGIHGMETLKQHFLSHAALRPFVCSNCDAGFASKLQLDTHMKLHEKS